MEEQEAHDLLIRIDTRLGGIEIRMERMEIAQGKRLCHTNAERIKGLEQRVSGNLPCQRNSEKIKGLERMVWGAVLVSIAGALKSFLFGGGH